MITIPKMWIYLVLISLRLTWRWKRLINLSIYHPREHHRNTEATHTITRTWKCYGKMKISFTITAGQENIAVDGKMKISFTITAGHEKQSCDGKKINRMCTWTRSDWISYERRERYQKRSSCVYPHQINNEHASALDKHSAEPAYMRTSNISWWISKCSWQQSRLAGKIIHWKAKTYETSA